MDEFSFIQSIKQSYHKQPSLVRGIGDDAAVFRQTTEDIVTAVDTFVNGVHFSEQTMSPFQIGYRALAANISDLAAMGATPAFYLVSVVIPKLNNKVDIQALFKGMSKIASAYKMDLIGGDTVAGKELAISITVIGYVQKGKARYRHDACDRDIVFVTGTLGDSQAGFHILNHDGHYSNKEYYVNRHWMPSPRVAFAKALNSLNRVALNDISDGLANEASEIAEASKVNVILYEEKIPVSKDYHQFPVELQRKWKYFGGEDFELLGTVEQSDWDFVKKVAKQVNIQVTEIGYVQESDRDHGQVWLHENDHIRPLDKLGYVHFR